MTTMDEAICRDADAMMHAVRTSQNQTWHRIQVMFLVREIERLRQGSKSKPELTFWLGADA